MRIGVSARGLSIPIGGVRKVMDEALLRLPRLGPQHEVVSYQNPDTPVMPGVKPIWVHAPHPMWWEWVALPRELRRSPPDVVFATKTMLPPNLPPRLKTLVMVYDLLYFPIRGKYLHEYQWQDIVYNRLFYKSTCRRATAIACISEHTRKDLLSVCPISPQKVHVVSLGVQLPEPSLISPEHVTRVQAQYGLTKPYIFYAGSLSPRKNMVRGVRAWSQVASRCDHDLVVTAGKSWRDQAVEDEVDRLGLRNRFRRLGSVSERDMSALYAGADVFFFPSLYEGFGLPVLEAMACGCPVVASQSSSIPEVAGSAALLVDPMDEQAMGDALWRVISEPSLADDLRRAGCIQAARFSWDRTIRDLLQIMEAMVTT